MLEAKHVQSDLKTSTTCEILTHLLVLLKKLLRTRNLSFDERVKFVTSSEHG